MFRKTADKLDRMLFLETGMHLAGNRELVIENCRRIEECSDVFMCLAAKGMLVKIWGSDLRAFDFRTHGLVIRGRISQIELEERRKRRERSAERMRQDKR